MKRMIGAAVLVGVLGACGSQPYKVDTLQVRVTTTAPAPTTTIVKHDPISTNGIGLTGTAQCDGDYWLVKWQVSGAQPGSFVSWAGGDGTEATGAVLDDWGADMAATFRYPLSSRVAYETVAVSWYVTEGGQPQKWPHEGQANATVIQPRCVVG